MADLRLLHVLGARPQFIKYFPIQRAIDAWSGPPIANAVVHTGQHYDYRMSAIFFDELGIHAPDYHLEVGSADHARQTALIMERFEEVLRRDAPDVVVVYGDTNSTLAGALAAVKRHIPVAHVEAGLRSYRKGMPEEINRVLTDHASTWLFCPSDAAAANLEHEGFARAGRTSASPDVDHPAVVVSGDVMYDVLIHAVAIAERKSRILDELGLRPGDYQMLTLHRAENTDRPDALAALVEFVNCATSGRTVIFPMHPRMVGAYEACPRKFEPAVRIIKPLGYFDLVTLLKNAEQLLTDSGGLQKEAYWLKVPCVTLREETEWIETVEAGWNTLYREYPSERPRSSAVATYGDGNAAEKIVTTLLETRPTIEPSADAATGRVHA
jgi:UDP-N-acetylglucosamine 2-epimerase